MIYRQIWKQTVRFKKKEGIIIQKPRSNYLEMTIALKELLNDTVEAI